MERSTPKLRCLKKGYDIDEHLETRFIKLKEIKRETILGIAKMQPKKLNDRKGLSKSQQNLERIQVLHKEQS